jgi:hypothetical protein
MTRVKFDYDKDVIGAIYSYKSPEYYEAVKKNRAAIKRRVQWTNGVNTHNDDGTYTTELEEWLQASAEHLEYCGYGRVGERINIWNAKLQFWSMESGSFQFSQEYRDYLLSEGYLKQHIDRQERVLAEKYNLMGYVQSPDYINERIYRDELPNASKRDPLDGLMSEYEIRDLQREGLKPHQMSIDS